MTLYDDIRLENKSCLTPITCLTTLGTELVLSGSGTFLQLASLNSDLNPQPLKRCKVFKRERIHRIVLETSGKTDSPRVVVLGGKEVVLVKLSLPHPHDISSASITVVARFVLDDFAGDAAFLFDDKLMISTLHNSIHVFPLIAASSPLNPVARSVQPIMTIHAPKRPLLWTSRFSKPHYNGSSQQDSVRIAAGSLLGDVLIWDVPLTQVLERLDLKSPSETSLGQLQRLSGHRGAIFTVAFSPNSSDLLATGSDDRTLRIWDLSPFSKAQAPVTELQQRVETGARTLWGHEGRVWRIDWVDQERLVSVGEDATCRLWQLSASSNGKEQNRVVQTWRDGHDGRSIWSVCVTRSPRSRDNVLTGGADGAIRSWNLPDLADLASLQQNVRRKLPKQGQIKSFTVAVDPRTDQPLALSLALDGSFYLSNPSESLESQQPFHTLPSFSNSPASLDLDISATGQVSITAFSNRGDSFCAKLQLSSDPTSPIVTVQKINHSQSNIKAVSTFLSDDRTRIAIWERATWSIHIISLEDTILNPVNKIQIEQSLEGTTAPTAISFIRDNVGQTIIMVGNARGELSTFSLDTDYTSRSISLHSDGVQDMRIVHCDSQDAERPNRVWDIETVGRDGMKKILYSFESPGKQIPAQLVQTRQHGASYYRLAQGALQVQRQLAVSSFASIINFGLHGREIRATKMQRIEVNGEMVTLVATAAENGVLAISELMNDKSLRPLYINRYLPSALKALAFSHPSPSKLGSRTTLYACGTRELVTAFELDVVRFAGQSIEVRILEKGTILAETEGGEVRTMDIAVLAAPADTETGGLVVSGYSNGKLRLWRHHHAQFDLLAETEGLGKCVLSVDVQLVKVAGRNRVIAIAGQSDGRLSFRDLSEVIESSLNIIPQPILTLSPHQSGINGLSVVIQGAELLVATAGDDNAVSVQRIDFQGLNFLASGLLASSSVEQRLNIYRVPDELSAGTLEIVSAACLDVADCSAQDAIKIEESEGKRWQVIVSGIGVEVIEVTAGRS
ncbi:tRNA (34-2'-O)-methyltransferase regulator RTT10 [Sporobolomyces koalae]|uniref:tRNA (34-2'-O)-methyltransferase regulator RTT10 n=1 Tax=Sporobolomyces koalae TaxID=500713 RepID=UPI00317FB0C2